MDIKLILSLTGSLLGLIAAVPYIRDILQGKTKPHAVTWLIWTILTGVAFAGQLAGKGGFGSAVLGVTTFTNIVILGFSFKYLRSTVKRFDLVLLIGAFTAFLLWQFIDDPTYSVVFSTFIFALGSIPTCRKSWRHPEQETSRLYEINSIKHFLGILAQSNYNLLTLLYPISNMLMNITLIYIIRLRKHNNVAA